MKVKGPCGGFLGGFAATAGVLICGRFGLCVCVCVCVTKKGLNIRKGQRQATTICIKTQQYMGKLSLQPFLCNINLII